MGGLQSLASEYGVNLNVADFINDKPSFYIPDIVNSRILKKLLFLINGILIMDKLI